MRNRISGNTSQLNRDVATSLFCKSLFLMKLFSLIPNLVFLVDRYYEEKASNSLSKKGDCQTSSAVVS